MGGAGFKESPRQLLEAYDSAPNDRERIVHIKQALQSNNRAFVACGKTRSAARHENCDQLAFAGIQVYR